MQWLFLRGAWDEKTERSIATKDDMWLDLFDEISYQSGVFGTVYFKDIKTPMVLDNRNLILLNSFQIQNKSYDYIFARGGFSYYEQILKQYPESYKIYYGAGRRFCPPPMGVEYDLIICDTIAQKEIGDFVHPNVKTWVWRKPAANIFTPIANVNKRYDVCFIANGEQAHFKGVQWVYDTCPRDISILHLGTKSKYKAPENVTCFHAPRVDMPNLINQCHMGIVPYWNKIDSCPRVIPEMLACGLPLVVSDELNGMESVDSLIYKIESKKNFWDTVKIKLQANKDCHGLNNDPYRLAIDIYNKQTNVKSIASELLEIVK